MNKIVTVLLLFVVVFSFSQNRSNTNEQLPQFENCSSSSATMAEACFYNSIQELVFKNYKIPEQYNKPDFKSEITTVFSVEKDGSFTVLYIDAPFSELKEEMKRVFSVFPKIKPATYSGNPIYSKYNLKFKIPFKQSDLNSLNEEVVSQNKSDVVDSSKSNVVQHDEFKDMGYVTYDNPKYKTTFNIPFSHSYYAQFDDEMNRVGNNNHTASKPYTFSEVNKYYDFKENNSKLMYNKTSWWGRKLFNEDLVAFQTEDYWLTVNFIFDLRLGKDSESKSSYTFHNTRALQAQAGLGKNLTFTTTIFESQGRFADYYNRYAESIKPEGGNPAIIPGIGIAKDFKKDAYDFPSADANISYSANKFLNLQLGYGRNFIGDGYRSLLMGDGASPYPYLKINTTFWKFKYTNTYTSMKDVRADVTNNRTYATKYMVNHYLSYNVNKRLNIGFFESVIWSNNNQRGFDANFLNPVIFYRTVEFTSSARTGNATMGLTTKYKFSNRFNLYGQFLLDEFSLQAVKAQEGSWQNKYGAQLGFKYYDALGVKNLLMQLEYNMVRPYTYSHSEPITNYGHNNQNVAHNWGTNFREVVFITRYFKGRWFADAKVTFGIRGFDYDTATDKSNYGSDIYKDYDIDRHHSKGVKIGDGNKSKIIIGDINVGYLVNPMTNLKLFANLIYRDFAPEKNTTTIFKERTTWISVGLRSDIFNFYTDY